MTLIQVVYNPVRERRRHRQLWYNSESDTYIIETQKQCYGNADEASTSGSGKLPGRRSSAGP